MLSLICLGVVGVSMCPSNIAVDNLVERLVNIKHKVVSEDMFYLSFVLVL